MSYWRTLLKVSLSSWCLCCWRFLMVWHVSRFMFGRIYCILIVIIILSIWGRNHWILEDLEIKKRASYLRRGVDPRSRHLEPKKPLSLRLWGNTSARFPQPILCSLRFGAPFLLESIECQFSPSSPISSCQFLCVLPMFLRWFQYSNVYLNIMKSSRNMI